MSKLLCGLHDTPAVRRVVGSLCVLAVALLWTAASYLVQFIYVGAAPVLPRALLGSDCTHTLPTG